MKVAPERVVTPIVSSAVEHRVPAGIVERVVTSGVPRDRYVYVDQAPLEGRYTCVEPRVTRSVGPVERCHDVTTTVRSRVVAPVQTTVPQYTAKITDANVRVIPQAPACGTGTVEVVKVREPAISSNLVLSPNGRV